MYEAFLIANWTWKPFRRLRCRWKDNGLWDEDF